MTDSNTSEKLQPERRQQRSSVLRTVLIVATIALLMCGVWFFNSFRDTCPLPDVADVHSLDATFYDQEEQKKVAFHVPREHWNAILSALMPARRDQTPAKWVGLGELKIELANGKSWFVSLYSPDTEPGAFAVGPTFESRVYYRGGNRGELTQALAEAFKSAESSSGRDEQ